MKCPKCYRTLHPDAAQCHYSDCHAYFDKSALLWLRRDKIQERTREQARLAKLEEEEKERKKQAAAAAKAAAPAAAAATAAAPAPAKPAEKAPEKPAQG